MEPTARMRGSRESRTESIAETLRPACEASAPGMVRYLRTRFRHHGYPCTSEKLLSLLERSYSHSLSQLPLQGPAPRPPAFRKSLTTQARIALWATIEDDQRAHLEAAIDAFSEGQSDRFKSPVPPRTLAQLARTVTAAVDQLPDVRGRILLRSLLTATHTSTTLARLLDLRDVAGALSRAYISLSEILSHTKSPGLPGYIQSLKDEPLPPPAALLTARRSEQDSLVLRVCAWHVLGGMNADGIAEKLEKKPESIGQILIDKGLGEGPWAQSGAMLVDMAEFTRELEKRDLTNFVDGLVQPGGEHGAGSWELFNRDVKVTAFWTHHLLARIHRSTFGPGLTGPLVRVRLGTMKKDVSDLRKWLDHDGLEAHNLGSPSARKKLGPQLRSLTDPHTSLPPEKELLQSLGAQLQKQLGRFR